MDADQEGGLASLSSEFADYAPTYICLVYFASGLVPLVGPVPGAVAGRPWLEVWTFLRATNEASETAMTLFTI